MFHHFMRSEGLTDLSLGSNLDFRSNQARGKVFKWLKLVVAGFFVVALNAEFRVRYFRDEVIVQFTPTEVTCKSWLKLLGHMTGRMHDKEREHKWCYKFIQ
jgi:hypothetical protein